MRNGKRSSMWILQKECEKRIRTEIYSYIKYDNNVGHTFNRCQTYFSGIPTKPMTSRTSCNCQTTSGGTDTSHYTHVCVCVSVYALRVQFSPVTCTALIQMNSTLCANLKSICEMQLFREYFLHSLQVFLFVVCSTFSA